MKVLASADVHGIWPIYEWLLAVARKHSVDMIVLAGDLMGCPDGFDTVEDAQRHEAKSLAELLDSAGMPVLYIMGNDDFVEMPSRSARVRSVHGHRVELGRFAFAGYQYSLPFMGGTFEKPEAEIQTDLDPLAPLLDAHTVFVSHSPALGILDPGVGQVRIGSSSIRELLERRPFRAHIHGHSHAGFGRDGKHFNVASAGSARTMLLDLETMQHEVIRNVG